MLVTAIVLDARLTLDEGRARLERRNGRAWDGWIAVRRLRGLVLLWYALPPDALRAGVLVQGARGDESLEALLAARKQPASPWISPDAAGDGDVAPAEPSVVCAGDEVLGIALPAAPAADPAPRASGSRRSAARGAKGFGFCDPGEGKDVFFHGDPHAPRADAGDPPDAAPFTAHPLIEAPARVAPGQKFSLFVGLSALPVADVVGKPLSIPLPAGQRRFELTLLVQAPGFTAPRGLRHVLAVDRDQPYRARCDIPLVAPEAAPESGSTVRPVKLAVTFEYGGAPCGRAVRRIAVVPRDSQPFAEPGERGQLVTRPAAPHELNVSTASAPADLTAYLDRPAGDASSGQLVMQLSSPHPVPLPALDLALDLGTDVASFAREVVEGVQRDDRSLALQGTLDGLGDLIASKLPAQFWTTLRAVHACVAPLGRAPTVLLLTVESQVPWELALVDPPLDPARPPFLGCQVSLGRWPLGEGGPPLPPPQAIAVERMAVVVGDYASESGMSPLAHAKDEGRALTERYAAAPLVATEEQVIRLLDGELPGLPGKPGAQALHFACHGEADARKSLASAIILAEGRPLSSIRLRRTALGRQHGPFLFLNACQVGAAGQALGETAGFAGHSLHGGFRGFLGPLWEVNDALAGRFALEFYERVFGTGRLPQGVAEALRDLRQAYGEATDGRRDATWLAYVFYGHPALRLRRTGVASP